MDCRTTSDTADSPGRTISASATRIDLHVDVPHALRCEVVATALRSNLDSGLTDKEASRRLAIAGRNELDAAPVISAWRRFLLQFKSPLVLLLIAATGISFVVWAIERESAIPYEALTILAIVIANAALGYFQEARAEATIASLRKMTAAQSTVLRDNVRVAVPAAEIVPGDVLVIDEGATIPADARVFHSTSLRTMEAALTGESAPVSKDVEPVPADAAMGDRSDMLFAGTAVAFGHGRAIVTATGMRAEIGRIADLLAHTVDEQTPLQAELDRTGRVLGAVVITIAVVVGATLLLMQRDFSLTVLTTVLLYTIALAVAAVPEGLSAITTVVLSLGMQRMAGRNVIVRRLSAVETLGAATVICSDKTGTLTKNEMTVRTLITAGGRIGFTGSGYDPHGSLLACEQPAINAAHAREIDLILSAGFVSNNAELVERDGLRVVIGDPTEGALQVAALKAGLVVDRMRMRFARVGEIPFSPERKLMSTAHTHATAAEGGTTLFVKGAPDVLLARCHAERIGDSERPLTDARRLEISDAINTLADEALRTLGIAYRLLPDHLAVALHPRMEEELVWLGVVGMIDPPRSEAAAAVRTAQQAGVRVIMITGDHPRTAAAIGQELGICDASKKVLAGVVIETMDAAALAEAVQNVSVFARVSPEHKLRIVHALKHHGHVVAMTGDGVNDAPALKAADIGVAMGITGTDVAKGAADMVLTDDNFASIVAAIEEGRSIYSNIQKYLRYLLATNLGEVIVMFVGVVAAGLLGIASGAGEALVLPLTATMILWINLVTDSGPALAVGIDPPSQELMKRSPRDPKLGIITPLMWRGVVFVAVVMGVGTLGVLDAALPGGLIAGDGSIEHARTLAFHTLVLFSLFTVFAVRSDQASAMRDLFSNGWLWLAIAASLTLQAAVLYLPVLQRAFNTVPLTASDWILATAVASSALWLRELDKLRRKISAAKECGGT